MLAYPKTNGRCRRNKVKRDRKPTRSDFFQSHQTEPQLVRQSLSIGAIAICNAGLAMIMPWYVVIMLGVSQQTDAFFASGALPQFVFLVLTATLLPVAVPLLATAEPGRFRQDVWSFFSLIVAVFILIALVLGALSSVWVPLFVPGFTLAQKTLTLTLMRIQLVSMILNAAVVALWAAHHVRRRFIWVEASSIIANLAGVFFLVFTLRRFGIVAAAWNTVFYNALKLVLLLPILGRPVRMEWRTPAITEAWRRLKPLLPGHVYLRTDPLVDRFLTSMTHAGTLSVLYLSQQLYASGVLFLGKSVVAPMTPSLALDARSGNWDGYRRSYQQRLLFVLINTTLVCAIVFAGRRLLVIMIGYGGVTPHNVETLWIIMVALAGTFVGGALVQVTAGAFYAAGDTKTPSKISALLYTLCIPFKVGAFQWYGVIGLAVVTSAFFLVNFGVQLITLRRRVGLRGPLFSGEALLD